MPKINTETIEVKKAPPAKGGEVQSEDIVIVTKVQPDLVNEYSKSYVDGQLTRLTRNLDDIQEQINYWQSVNDKFE